jgi:hypothetical protein
VLQRGGDSGEGSGRTEMSGDAISIADVSSGRKRKRQQIGRIRTQGRGKSEPEDPNCLL